MGRDRNEFHDRPKIRRCSIGWKGAQQAASIQGRHVATPTMPAR
jgi:hypothetical protein